MTNELEYVPAASALADEAYERLRQIVDVVEAESSGDHALAVHRMRGYASALAAWASYFGQTALRREQEHNAR